MDKCQTCCILSHKFYIIIEIFFFYIIKFNIIKNEQSWKYRTYFMKQWGEFFDVFLRIKF